MRGGRGKEEEGVGKRSLCEGFFEGDDVNGVMGGRGKYSSGWGWEREGEM